MRLSKLIHLGACVVAVSAIWPAGRVGAQPYHIVPGESVLSFGGAFATSVNHPNSLIVIGQPVVGRASNLDYTIDVGLVSTLFAPPPTTIVFWNAGAGVWTTPANWLPVTSPVGPTNNANVTYAVYINNTGNDDDVTLDTNPSITRLTVALGAILQVNQSSGSATRVIAFDPASATNANNAGAIRATVTTGASRLFQLTDMKLNQAASGVLEAVSTQSAPTATVRLVDSRVVGGTVRANGPGAIVQIRNSFIPDGTDLDDGTFEAINGGVLDIGTGVGGGGLYVATGGTILLRPGGGGNTLSGSAMTVSEGGSLDIDGMGATTYTATISGDSTFTGGPPGWGSSPPVLSIGSNGHLSSVGSIAFNNEAGVFLGAGSLITVGGNWNNQSTGTEFNSEMGAVQMNAAPGTPPALQTFELAGIDLGLSEVGFQENFALLSLAIGPDRIVRFEDEFSNTPPHALCGQPGYQPETLYVNELVFGSGSQISVKCGTVYYKTSAGGGTGYSVIFLDGGRIVYAGIPGDIDGTNTGATGDVTAFIEAMLQGFAANPDRFFRADMNHDGVVDGRDIQLLVDALL